MTGRRDDQKTSAHDTLRVLVVDDEPLARDDIVHLLAGREGVDVAGTCASGAEAIAAVRELRPDVLLLDVRMPGIDGFGVVAKLDRTTIPYVVFVTAFDRYAIDAFRVGALDYLLKPVQPARLDEALARARSQLRMRSAVDWASALQAAARDQAARSTANALKSVYWSELLVRIGIREIVVRTQEIDWVEADTYYAKLHVGDRSYLLRERMHVLESRLDPECFTRVHRSAIVNLDRVREIVHDRHGDHIVVLSTGARIRTSHQRWLSFRDIMRRRARPDLA